MGQKRHPQSAGNAEIGGDSDRAAQKGAEGIDHPLVMGDTALKKNMIPQGTVTDHPGQVVSNDAVGQARHNVGLGLPPPQGLGKRPLNEHGAALSKIQGGCRFE